MVVAKWWMCVNHDTWARFGLNWDASIAVIFRCLVPSGPYTLCNRVTDNMWKKKWDCVMCVCVVFGALYKSWWLPCHSLQRRSWYQRFAWVLIYATWKLSPFKNYLVNYTFYVLPFPCFVEVARFRTSFKLDDARNDLWHGDVQLIRLLCVFCMNKKVVQQSVLDCCDRFSARNL